MPSCAPPQEGRERAEIRLMAELQGWGRQETRQENIDLQEKARIIIINTL